MSARESTTDAIEILDHVVFKKDPKRLEVVEQHRLNSEIAGFNL